MWARQDTRIHVLAPDYKKAEAVLKKAAQSAITIIEKSRMEMANSSGNNEHKAG